MFGCVQLALWAALTASTPKVAVLPVKHDATVAKDFPRKVFDDVVLTALHRANMGEVIGPDDVNDVLGLEKHKDLLGCDDTACFAELAGALGADRLFTVRLAKLPKRWVMTSKLIDVSGGGVQVMCRGVEYVQGDLGALLDKAPSIVTKVCPAKGAAVLRTPASTPPSATPPAASTPPRVVSGSATILPFAPRSVDLSPEAQRLADTLIQKLRASPQMRVKLVGHTNSMGAARYNATIGATRADAVRRDLKRNGIAIDRIDIRSAGETQPIAPNTGDDYAKNDRVEAHPMP